MENPRWILLAVCVIGMRAMKSFSIAADVKSVVISTLCCNSGVVLAYVTDEGYSLLVEDEGASIPKSIMAVKNNSGIDAKIKSNKLGDSLTSLVVILHGYCPEVLASTLDRFFLWTQKSWAKYQLYRESLALKKYAKTKRQFAYLLEKKILNLPIKADETEIDSYLDCKTHMGQNWPFMWEVSNVKAIKIGCAGFDCIPFSSYRS